MTKRTFMTYNALDLKLRRDGIKKPGVVANLLLQTFIFNNGDLTAGAVERRGLCKKNMFRLWREELEAKGWLVYKGEFTRHYPGAKLVGYVNKEKLVFKEIATTDQIPLISDFNREILASTTVATVEQVTKVDEKIEYLENKINEMEQAIQFLIEKYDPPYDEEKKSKYLSIVK